MRYLLAALLASGFCCSPGAQTLDASDVPRHLAIARELVDPSHKITGLGKGTIRLYADSEGDVVGWARTFPDTNRFFSYSPKFPSDTKLRKAVIGRPVAEGPASDRAAGQ